MNPIQATVLLNFFFKCSTYVVYFILFESKICFLNVIPIFVGFSNLMVDQNITDSHVIKEKITSALQVLRLREPRVLVQFWSPVAVRKRWLLTTWDQPFGLGVPDEDLYLYRLKSELRAIVVDREHRQELDPPGRVYSQKLPEWSMDQHGLSTRQYVHDGNSCYNFHGYIDLPVFESSGDCCVGVLEIITSSNYADYAFEVQEISRALEVVPFLLPYACVIF